MESMFVCPLCRGALSREEKRLFCAKGHSFDLSKAGYANLLVGKGGGVHGDNKEMIRARKDFLEGGYYLPLRDALEEALRKACPESLLDVGCGECYYTEGMANVLGDCSIAGIDISKDALAYGAKRMKGSAETAVASAYDLPLSDGRVEALTLFFSPYAGEEFKRVLKKDGLFLMAIPGKRHLWELKSILYKEPYENKVADFALDGFVLEGEDYISTRRRVEGRALSDLFAMTPYFYRTPREGVARAKETEELEVGFEFHLLTYRKSGQ